MVASCSWAERELQHVLQGRAPKSWDRFDGLKVLRTRPFAAVRAAGSHGADLTVSRDHRAYTIEVKACHGPTVYFTGASGRAVDQYDELLREAMLTHNDLLYAFRRIGQGPWLDGKAPWRLYLAHGTITGIPSMDPKNGRAPVLKWDEGMPLENWVHHADHSAL